MNIVIATVKSWNIRNAEKLIEDCPGWNVSLITDKYKLAAQLEASNPDFVFFPHWSWKIPPSIYENYNCVVFHMTDLPFGRGGSPLQNLIVRGIYETMISAIQVTSGIDEGPVYFKEPMDISEGNADEMLSRASDIIFFKMIPRLIGEKFMPKPQEGNPTIFKRRLADQSEIPGNLSNRQIYDYIRMLDGEGYPKAFSKYGQRKVCYSNAKYENGRVMAEAEFIGED